MNSPTQSPPPPATGAHPPHVYGPGYYSGAPVLDSGFVGSLHPMRLLRVVRQKWKIVLLVVLFASAAAAFYLLTAPRIYRAVSLIEMSQRRPRIMNQQGAVIEDPSYTPSEEVFNTRLRKFSGQALRPLAVARLKALYPPAAREGVDADAILGGAGFALLAKTRIVQISCERSDPALAAASANAFAAAAEQYAIEENRIASDSAVAWLQNQAESQRRTLERAEDVIVAFRVTNHVDRLESLKKALEDSVLTMGRSLSDLDSQEALTRQTVEALAALEAGPESASKLPDAAPRGDEIRVALEKWAAAVSERDALRTRYTAKHPLVETKEQDIAVLRGRVIESLRHARETAESNLSLIRRQAGALRARVDELGAQATTTERQIVETRNRLLSLDRERDACDIAYRGILNRIEEARLSADETTATVKVVEQAGVPSVPVRPRPQDVWMLAAVLGLFLGLVLALLTDTLEDRIVGADDIERDLGLRILGLVPSVTGDRETLAMAVLNEKFGQMEEAFAGVRTVIESTAPKGGYGPAVVIASTAPEEGKTVTACNLAITSARTGQRTVLVDMDLRRPRLGRIFRAPDSAASLIQVLGRRDAAAFDRLPFASPCPNLDVIASRPTSEFSPAQVLGDPFVSEFFQWLRGRYERIVIDTPPFGAVSDCVVLAGLAGNVIMVCRPDRSRKRAARYAARQFVDSGARLIGVVVNGVDMHRNMFMTNYHHYYAYSHYRHDAAEAATGGAKP